MNFDKVQFVYVDIAYLKKMNEIDSEIFYDEKNENYAQKPHLGILINHENREYVIPLTSAKNKHRTWADVTSDWYRIYEIIDVTKVYISPDDVIVDIKNQEILRTISKDMQNNYKQRIISVLDIRKMFPVRKEVYTKINFNIGNAVSKQEKQKHALMMKEYLFLNERKDKIAEKAGKIYNKQIAKGKVLPYCCDYRKLEKAADEYLK